MEHSRPLILRWLLLLAAEELREGASKPCSSLKPEEVRICKLGWDGFF